ncbi:ROOT INITIATION DEFECTIVE 1 [Hibiscus trionum]|uniref:RNA helicase n=1 Tax=Hibiscus trionum TaxID=183268 RepID=A0A9W7J7R9_HIBTR|nr:ROOT INITIATION DEFECTIVE 1 [Hibiscus trionum]
MAESVPNGNLSFKNNRNNNKPSFVVRREKLLEQRKSLSIASVERRLVEEVQKHDVLIIVGETGSGKTTQIPQFLFDSGFCGHGKTIGVTQPRRVAAVTVAKRVAEECGVGLGQKVGYSIRFEDVTSSSTRIKYMTDGLLLREALLDPYLSRYSVIVVDEAHERTVHTDVLLGLLKKVQNVRSKYIKDHTSAGHKRASNGTILEKENADPSISVLKQCQGRKLSPLKLVIMSASLDAHIFSEYFGGAKAVRVLGRQFPVDVFYTVDPQTDYLDSAIVTIFQIHSEEAPGDILVFLTGQEEIESVEKQIHENLQRLPEEKRNMKTVTIFSSLPSEQQMRVFAPAPAGFRKVILATNIAETSVTIPGIKYVIDPGVVKARSYDPVKGMESLIIVPTSKAQAIQRSGRAGREGPGKCFRLYPESEYEKLEDSTKPEIKRCNLSNVILQLKALGVDDIFGFDFIEKPSREAIKKSLEELILLGALSDELKLSDPVGRQMARLPLDPVYSKALILGSQFKCLDEMLIAVAMLSVESMFYEPREKLDLARTAKKCFASSEGDHLTLINFLESGARKTSSIAVLCDMPVTSTVKSADTLNKWAFAFRLAEMTHFSSADALLLLFFLNAALKQPDGTYRALASGEVVQIHPTSVLFRTKADCIVFNEFVKTTNKYIRNITIIDGFWLTELAPHYYAKQD